MAAAASRSSGAAASRGGERPEPDPALALLDAAQPRHPPEVADRLGVGVTLPRDEQVGAAREGHGPAGHGVDGLVERPGGDVPHGALPRARPSRPARRPPRPPMTASSAPPPTARAL